MILVTVEDFNKFYSLAQSVNNTEIIQEYIDRFEESYIKRILGVELGQLFIDDIQGADSDSSVIEDRFQAIRDPFIKQDGCRYVMESKGMLAILCGFIYYHYVSDGQLKHTQSGVTLSQSEVSNSASPLEAVYMAESKFNESLISAQAVQWFCGVEESDDYPEYEGTYLRPKYSNLL